MQAPSTDWKTQRTRFSPEPPDRSRALLTPWLDLCEIPTLLEATEFIVIWHLSYRKPKQDSIVRRMEWLSRKKNKPTNPVKPGLRVVYNLDGNGEYDWRTWIIFDHYFPDRPGDHLKQRKRLHNTHQAVHSIASMVGLWVEQYPLIWSFISGVSVTHSQLQPGNTKWKIPEINNS